MRAVDGRRRSEGEGTLVPSARRERGEAGLFLAVLNELRQIDLNEPRWTASFMSELRTLLQLETLLLMVPAVSVSGLVLERFDTDNVPERSKLRAAFSTFFRGAPTKYAWYDVACPEPDQRNCTIEPHELTSQEEFESSRIYDQVLRPAGLHRHRQLRVLLCDGGALLAWFGSFHPLPIERRHHDLLQRLIPDLQRRLRMERHLDVGADERIALHIALEQVGSPAFVLGKRGRVLGSNAAGRAAYNNDPHAMTSALARAVAGGGASTGFQLTKLRDTGTDNAWLALHNEPALDQLTNSVERARKRWALTPRQADILRLVLNGLTNAAISAELHTSVRAVEQHVSALFTKLEVDSRAALVALVLLTCR